VSDLKLLTPSLQREVAVPGTFDTFFPSTTSLDLQGAIQDAFWTAILDGWFPGVTIDANGLSTPDMSRDGQQLVVIYAAKTMIENLLTSQATTTRYKAGSVEFESQQSASVLKARLDGLAARVKDLITRVSQGSSTPVFSYDGYGLRATAFYYYELPLGQPGGYEYSYEGSYGAYDGSFYDPVSNYQPGDPGGYGWY
jgi:hypothetical protein